MTTETVDGTTTAAGALPAGRALDALVAGTAGRASCRVAALIAEARRRVAGTTVSTWHLEAAPDALRGDILAAFLADEVERLRADATQLDWLEQFATEFTAHNPATGTAWAWGVGPGPGRLRGAIADAMREDREDRAALATPTPAAPGARGA